MKTLITKATTALATIGLFAIGAVTFGLGFAVVAMLAMFALAVIGLGLIASPFIAIAERNGKVDADDAEVVEETASTASA